MCCATVMQHRRVRNVASVSHALYQTIKSCTGPLIVWQLCLFPLDVYYRLTHKFLAISDPPLSPLCQIPICLRLIIGLWWFQLLFFYSVSLFLLGWFIRNIVNEVRPDLGFLLKVNLEKKKRKENKNFVNSCNDDMSSNHNHAQQNKSAGK